MNIQRESTGQASARIIIDIQPADYATEVKKQLATFCQKAQMPGFRQGHVPMGLARKMYGPKAKYEAVNKCVSDALSAHIKDENLQVLGTPLPAQDEAPKDLDRDEAFTFKFDVALAPEVSVTADETDEVPYLRIKVSPEDVEKHIQQMAQQMGHPEQVDSYENHDILRGTLCELTPEGQPKEDGVQVDKASIMPEYFKSEEQKALFEGAKKNDVLTFCPAKAYEGVDTEVASLLKISKEEVSGHTGNFSFQVDEISRYVPAELNEEFFKKVYGQDSDVLTLEAMRDKERETMEKLHEADSDWKFLQDARARLMAKAGEFVLAEDILRRVMKLNNEDKDEKYVDEHFEQSIKELKWHLVKEQLVKQFNIKLEHEDVKHQALEATRFQFAQYGMNNIPQEYLEQYATEMLKKEDQVQGLVERAIDTKLTQSLKQKMKLQEREVTMEEFQKALEA